MGKIFLRNNVLAIGVEEGRGGGDGGADIKGKTSGTGEGDIGGGNGSISSSITAGGSKIKSNDWK